MRARVVVVALLSCATLAAGCSGSGAPQESATSSCQASAIEIVERFDEFLLPHRGLGPEEFLAQPSLDGLEGFQDDIASMVQQVSGDPNDDCTERDLQDQVDLALQNYAGDGLLNRYLVGTLRQGVAPETRDIMVTPDDDLLAVLPLLGPGSSVRFSEGTFELDATLLIQSQLIIVGAGREETILNSSAEAAAIAVLGEGELVMNDMTVRHVGDNPASVLIAFDAPIELVGVGISGAVADGDGAGGSGVVLTGASDVVEGQLLPSASVLVTIDDGVISNNNSAGIAVTAALAPTILNSAISANEQCGICYFDTAKGTVQSTTFDSNQVGVQTSGASSPQVSKSNFFNSGAAGMLIEATSTPTVIGNAFEGEQVVGIDVQGEAAPTLTLNRFGAHAVSLSLRGASTANVDNNTIEGGDVGVLVGGTANPVLSLNEVVETTTAAILHTNDSFGQDQGSRLRPADGAGVVIENSAAPAYSDLLIEGGIVGVIFSDQAGGSVSASSFIGQAVGVEVGDDAAPEIRENLFRGSTEAGVIFSGQSDPVLQSNRIEAPDAIGIQLGGSGAPAVVENTVDGGDTGMLVIDSSQAVISANVLSGQSFGIGVSGSAAPLIEDNEISDATGGALSFDDHASGEVRNNMIADAGVVGIRVGGQAAPELTANTLFALIAASEPASDQSGSDTNEEPVTLDAVIQSGAGILYVDDAAGEAGMNQVFGFVIGIQVSDQASPDLLTNRVDGVGVGGVGILYGVDGAGTARDNLAINQQLGFQISDSAFPELADNTVESASVAGFLIQGEAAPELSGNECSTEPGIVVLEEAEPVLGDNACLVTR